MGREQAQNLRLSRLAALDRDECGGALLREDRLLQRELFDEQFVLLDPIIEIDRRKTDRERRFAGGVGRMEEGHSASGSRARRKL